MLVGLTSHAVTSSGGFGGALLTFGVAALTIVLLMFTLAALIGSAQGRAVDAMKASGPSVKRWGGGILVLVGAWLFLLGLVPHPFMHIFNV